MRARGALLALAGAAVVVGCGSSPRPRAAGPPPGHLAASSGPCPAYGRALAEVVSRVYGQAAGGAGVSSARRRILASRALRIAVAAGNAPAAARALQDLRAGQLARARVVRGGRVLAEVGSGPALGVASVGLGGAAPARVIVAVQDQAGLLALLARITAGRVAVVPASGPPSPGPRPLSVSLPVTVYPSGAARLRQTAPAPRSCPAGARQAARVAVARRVYAQEATSPEVAAAIARVRGSAAFRRAVAAGDRTAARAAIVAFFRSHAHIVRVRAWRAGRLVIDMGGPLVLAPVVATLPGGAGRFALAVQDDAGYLKLVHRFTGAEVVLRTAGRVIASTLGSPPAATAGPATVAGRRYEASSFAGTAFPSGRLDITILVPAA